MRESLSWGGVDTATWSRLSRVDHHEDPTTTSVCRRCRSSFSYFTRKHHCHMCGRVMCSSCIEAVDIDKEDTRRSSMFGMRATTLSSVRSQVYSNPGSRINAKLCVECCTRYVQTHMFAEATKSVALKASYTVPDTFKRVYDGLTDKFNSTVTLPRESMSEPPPMNGEEERRLEALHSLQILDTEPEQVFDVISAIAGATYDSPMAGISFIDEDREWFKSSIGFAGWDLPRSQSFGAQAVRWKQPIVLCNRTIIEQRYRGHPWLKGPLHIQFYANVPIKASSGHIIGVIFVMDTRPHNAFDPTGLRELATTVMEKLEAMDEYTVLNSSVMMQSVLSVMSSTRSNALESIISDTSSVEEIELQRNTSTSPQEYAQMLSSLLACQAQTQQMLDNQRTTYLSHYL